MANSNDAFSRNNGRLSKRQFELYLNQVPLQIWEREYVKRVMDKFDTSWSQGITRDEFLKGLDEMAKNPHDQIDASDIENIKRHF
ncbi:MAG: hypothetical protein O3C23_01835 [bacterium]|nr:hypothetical protein [bacterium]